MVTGIGVSKGIAIAKAFVVKKAEMKFDSVSKLDVVEEKKRFESALDKFIVNTQKIMENMGEAHAEILEAHIMIAQDPEISGNVIQGIEEGKTSESSVETSFTFFKNLFASMDDELMSQRASDLGDIQIRLLEILTGVESTSLQNIPYECIIVTHDLTPSDTGQMDKKMVTGILTEVGGQTSHTAIISRAMEIPAVLGVESVLDLVKDGDMLLLNGETGQVVINPTPEDIEKAEKIREEILTAKKELEKYKNLESKTQDGHHVELCANIGGLADIDSVINNAAEGIGLFRTEFLFMDRTDVPTEQEQFEIYKKVAESMQGKPVIIRTLDIGGDKDVPYLDMPKEDNPFLGYRAIRLCLDRKELFRSQLRALLRAGVFGNIKIMLPMITSASELREAKQFIEELKKELSSEGVDYDKDIQVGIMIETPAASLVSDLLAKECDFFSIGTNDLIQYTMAVDRGNKKVAYLYQATNPAVLRSIYNVIRNGKKAGIMVGMCGELAGDPLMVPFLVAAGLDEFSMTASQILPTKKLISSLNKKELESKIEAILNLSTAEEIKEQLLKLV